MEGKKVELCCLMAETGREERGGIPKGDMSYSHLLKKQRNFSYTNKKLDSFNSHTMPSCKHVHCTLYKIACKNGKIG
jgi:hypothetical protein